MLNSAMVDVRQNSVLAKERERERETQRKRDPSLNFVFCHHGTTIHRPILVNVVNSTSVVEA